MRILFTVLICCTALYAAAVEAPTVITVRAQIPWSNPEGYTPVLVSIESNKDDTIELEASGSNSSASRTVQVKAGQRYTETVLLPTSLIEVGYANVKWRSNSRKSGDVHCSPTIDYRQTLFVVCDRDNSITGNDFLNRLPESKSYHSGQRYIDMESASIPDYWQGIPLWIGILLTPSADSKLSTAQRQALSNWQRAGGHLFVTTRALQDLWARRGTSVSIANDNTNNYELQNVLNSINKQSNMNNRQYQVPGTDQVPVIAFVIILFVFIALVGPLNYWWVRRNNQLHLFLITTPIISGAFCILLGTFGLLADGLSAHRSSIELTWIDHANKQACTWTSISWFSGLGPGDISVSNDTGVRLLERSYNRYYDDRTQKQLRADWGSQQILSGDWLLSRTHQQLQYTRPHTEERRILLLTTANGYAVNNGFDRDIESFSWRDQSGNVWECANVQSGQQIQLEQREAGKRRKMPDAYAHTNRFAPDVQQLWEQRSNANLHFHALLSGPAYETPGPTADDGDQPISILCGQLLPQGAP